MKLVMHNGAIKEVDTKFIFNNQYNTTDGERVFDVEVKHIIDDIRLGEFYCCSKKQGTYDEVAKAIAEERSKINKCHDCWWFHEHNRIKDECHRESNEVIEGNKKTIVTNEKVVYELSCAYIPKYGNKCEHDIDETPILFREKNFCFFCEYPQGIPDMTLLKQFMVDNAEKYNIIPYWGGQELSITNPFKHNGVFGSYQFMVNRGCQYFELRNARHHFKFYVDVEAKRFILWEYSSYKVVNYLGVEVYNHITKRCNYEPIKNYDKFAKWFWQIVDDYKEATK